MPPVRLSLVLAGWLLAAMAMAQGPDVGPPDSVLVPYAHQSPSVTNTTSETRWLDRHTVSIPGAASLRLRFDAWTLGAGDWIEVYNPTDGERHALTPVELGRWENTSAYFNGSSVDVYLYVAPGSTASYSLVSVFAGGLLAGIGADTICGPNDDRVSTVDPRVARMVTSPTASGGGCTIWLAGPDSCAISAGHCFASGGLVVAEFNVPPSQPNGAFQHPPVEDQFTIDLGTVTFLNAGPGADWGVCQLNPNNMGETAADRFGFFTLGNFAPQNGDVIRITGHGSDDGVDNQVLQTHAGPFDVLDGDRLRYAADTTGGNSGSPVIDEATGEAIGVHTHGGCTENGGTNSGTWILRGDFQAALTALCDPGPLAVPVASLAASVTAITTGSTVHFEDLSTGVPTAWQWDLDGDGLVDSNVANPRFRYDQAGTYDVTLTVSNLLGNDSITFPALITVTAATPAAIPFFEGFSGGLPSGSEWAFRTELPQARVVADTDGIGSPISGGDALVFDQPGGGVFSTNEAVLHVDLVAQPNLLLRYWLRETSDEDHPEDGLWLSDGVNEIRMISHEGGPSDWTLYTLYLSQGVEAGLSPTTDFRIIFRQRDNFGLGTDGVLIDDVEVIDAIVDNGEANGATSTLSVGGMLDINGASPLTGQNGPFFISRDVGEPFTVTVSGLPQRPFLLLAGPLNRAAASFPTLGQLDVGLLGPASGFADVAIVLNGFQPLDFFDGLGTTGPAGASSFGFVVPPLPPGPFATLQAAVGQADGTPRLTAAVEITIP